jgi:hypothetical protein
MSGWRDDFEQVRRRAGELLAQGEREVRRQADLGRLQVRLLDVERRRRNALRRLGERVWDLHRRGAVNEPMLAEAFAELEALALEASRLRDALADRRGPRSDEREGPAR